MSLRRVGKGALAPCHTIIRAAVPWPEGDRASRRPVGRMCRRANRFRFSELVSSEKFSRIENISVSPKPNHRYITPIPSRPEGRIMIATIVGRVAVDAGSADSERHESVRQRRVVLTPQAGVKF